MTKRDEAILNRYYDAYARDLYDVYGVFSREKYQAYENCIALERDLNGYDFRIIGANTFGFSVGFLFERDGEEYLMYITKDNRREIRVED